MNVNPPQIVAFTTVAGAYLAVAYLVDRALSGKAQVVFRYALVALTLVIYFAALGGVSIETLGISYPGLVKLGVLPRERAVDVSKTIIAVLAASCVFYEQQRAGMRRPIAERWKRFIGVTLGLVAILAYFDGLKFGYPKFYHRHDQYHYYMGAKYFHEMGYDGLYKCTAIAEDEIGVVLFDDENHIGAGRYRLDLSKEVRHPDMKIRNLGGDNLLMPVTEILKHPEICKSHFSPERWEEYKTDVRFFRIASDKPYWDGMQKDHGYNPPPVWTIAGHFFSSMYPAGKGFELPVIGHVVFLQVLAMLDVVYLGAMFVALYWAFGWRVFAVGAIFWGCQASAPIMWTCGAFLRQDWLFWLVFSACLVRKRYYALAGASMVYAGLLRIFPGVVVIGWLTVAGFHLFRHRTLTKPQLRMLTGGVLAALLLVPLSIKVSGKDSYREFYEHTLKVHDRTPLTNHMGLRVLVSQKVPFEIPALGIGTGVPSGRMRYTKNDGLTDPFEVWKRMRNERYDKLKPVAYGIILLSLAYFAFVVRRIKSMWIAQCLAQIFIILLAQLTSYYYVFMILLAPLTRVKRNLEVPLFGFAALSQLVFMAFGWNDDKYWALTAISLVFSYGILCAFLSQDDRDKIAAYFRRGKNQEAAPAAGERA